MNLYMVKQQDDIYKVGITSDNAIKRLKALQTGNPHKLSLFWEIETDLALFYEQSILCLFGGDLVGEWLNINECHAKELYKDIVFGDFIMQHLKLAKWFEENEPQQIERSINFYRLINKYEVL